MQSRCGSEIVAGLGVEHPISVWPENYEVLLAEMKMSRAECSKSDDSYCLIDLFPKLEVTKAEIFRRPEFDLLVLDTLPI